jgi:hypothetical protein
MPRLKEFSTTEKIAALKHAASLIQRIYCGFTLPKSREKWNFSQ